MAEVASASAPRPSARAAAVLVHGRGSDGDDMLALAQEFGQRDIVYRAPEARGRSWYPYSFLAPLEQNEPHLTDALETVGAAVAQLVREGFPSERIALIGFSQGGCLVLEYVARNARRYGAVAGLSAGLIGPPGTPRNYPGSLDRTPVFLGCSDIDPHIPLARVHESRDVLGAMGAVVDERIYPRMGHTVNADEVAAVAQLLKSIRGAAPGVRVT